MAVLRVDCMILYPAEVPFLPKPSPPQAALQISQECPNPELATLTAKDGIVSDLILRCVFPNYLLVLGTICVLCIFDVP